MQLDIVIYDDNRSGMPSPATALEPPLPSEPVVMHETREV